jgi:5-methylcytosine-specific restriction endonuclease McrA
VSWCHRLLSCFDFEVGHNIPESKGGTLDLDNLYPICHQCNTGMGNQYTILDWSNRRFNQ